MLLEAGKKERLDRAMALLLGVVVALVAYLTPSYIDYRAWQPICEGALLRPPEFFQPGVYRIIVYVLMRVFGLGATVKILAILGPAALGVIAYQATRSVLAVLTTMIKVDVVRTEFRTVMLPVLAMVGSALFILSEPVLHAASILTPSILELMWAFLVIGACRNFLVCSSMGWANWAVFLCGGLAMESLGGFALLVLGICISYRRVLTDPDQSFVLCDPVIFHVSKWTLTVLFLLGAGLVVGANAWFFAAHGGLWSTAFLNYATMPDPKSVALAIGLVVTPLIVTFYMMPDSSDSEHFLPYAHGLLLIMIALLEIFVCCYPEVLAIENESAKMAILVAASLTATAAIMTLLVDVYCRVQMHYPRLTRAVVFRLVIAALVAVMVPRYLGDGSRKLAATLDVVADEIVRESSGLKRLFSDGAMDALIELKAALKGERFTVHSMFSGHGDYEANLRCRGVQGDDDLSMMRIGASVAFASWVATDSPELKSSAAQLGFEIWKCNEKLAPMAGALVTRLDDWPSESLTASRAWGDEFVRAIMSGIFDRAYSTCHEKRLCEAFDMVKWRLGRMLELRAQEAERGGNHDTARELRRTVGQLDRQNGSLLKLRTFMNLVWNQDNLQLTPRESLKIALERANFRAARPHAEAVLSTDPEDVPANFALGMYHYVMKNFARAEGYLTEAHKGKPTDAAILNNLALVEMYLEKYESAEAHARAAKALKPEVKEIDATLREIANRKTSSF